MKYRMGVSYSSPYMNIAKSEGTQSSTYSGPGEMSVSMGLGLPISNQYTLPLHHQRGPAVAAPRTGDIEPDNGELFCAEPGRQLQRTSWFMKYKIR